MTDSTGTERLVKSTERVRDLGEVFTPSTTVRAILDLLSDDMWSPHPSATFLEPACGDGNFLVAILQRKLDNISSIATAGNLPAGASEEAVTFHALEALASIYAVDISIDNIVGGTPGHEVGARTRMLQVFNDWHEERLGNRLSSRAVLMQSARWIVDHNVQVGNMLPTDNYGRSSGRDLLPIIEYEWQPEALTVAVAATTFGAVLAAADVEKTGVMSLFDSQEGPAPFWSGPPHELRRALQPGRGTK